MEISELGEFGLIDRLTDKTASKNDSTLVSVGDDAAVLYYGEKEILTTTDLLLEGVHFDLRYVPMHRSTSAIFLTSSNDTCA